MGIFDGIRKAFSNGTEVHEVKNSGMVGYFSVSSSQRRELKYSDLANEGYLKNAIVYRCVNEVSKGAAAVPFLIFQEGEPLEAHPAISLLNRPNPLQSYSEFMSALFGYLLLSGNSYVSRTTGINNIPTEMHLLRPDRITIQGNGQVFPDKYIYTVDGKRLAEYVVDQENGYSDLKQIKLFHPLDDFYGLSPLTAASVEVDQHNLSSTHNINLLNNGARPSGAIIFKPQDDGGFTMPLNDSQRQQLLTDLNNRFSGPNNTGRPLLLEGDFDWREMGLSPKDMDFINLKHMSATDIAMCFGVPSQLVGVPDAQTYSNVAEARLALYEETIIPYLRKVQSDLNEWLMPMFGEGLEFRFDVDSIPALSERRRRVYENVLGAVREGIMTRNEARELIGLGSLDGGDTLLVNAALFPLNEPPPDEPVELEEELGLYGDDEKADHLTNFPKSGDNKKVSLRNSNYPQFDYDFAKNVKEIGVGKDIWKTGGNIRGNEAFGLWTRARNGSEAPSVLDWIKEREAWAARHFRDGQGFASGDREPNLSNVAGIVAQMKWGVIGTLGQQGMKDVILELTKKLEGKKDPDEEKTHSFLNHPFAEEDTKQLSEAVKEGLRKKVKDHNDEHGDKPSKRVNLRMLEAVFRRGVGAYNTNPASVRPRVRSSDQWAYARVNAFLAAVRTGRFPGGKFDMDLLPKGHPLSTRKNAA